MAGREPGGGGAGGAAPADLVPRVGPGERSGVRFCGRVRAKRYVTRGFGVSVRVLPLPRRTGSGRGGRWSRDVIGGRRQVGAVAGRAAWVAAGQPVGDRTLRAAKNSLDQETAEFAKNRVRTIRELPCPAGSARFGRSSGTVDRHRRYLRVGIFKGPSSLRSRVGVGTVRRTWLIRPAAKLRRATLHITCAWVGGVLYLHG